MKRLILLTLAVGLLASSASAADFGLRGGLTVDPDQFHFGGHINLGPVLDPLRVVPNIEIGLGSDFTVIAINGDVIYDFPDTPWSLGGELGMNYVDHDFGGSDTDFGLSVLGD